MLMFSLPIDDVKYQRIESVAMRSVSFLPVLFLILWVEVCQPDVTTIGSDIDSGILSKVQPKLYVVLLPPVFGIIGTALITISILTTLFCIAYYVFLPWVHALSSTTVVQSAPTSSPLVGSDVSLPNQPYYNAGGVPPYNPYYIGGGSPYFPNQPYPYYAGPNQPYPTECSTSTTATTTTTTTSIPESSTSQLPELQNVKETEEFFCENV